MSFDGFASGAPATPLPQALLRDLAPQMTDPAELVVTLYAVEALARVRRFPRLIARAELQQSRPLIETLASLCPNREVDAAFSDGIEAAIQRGTLISGRSQRDDAEHGWIDWIALNDHDGRRAMSATAAMPSPTPAPRGREPLASGAASIWQDAFGRAVPTILADELIAAESRYGVDWLRDAFREAAANDVRNWRYVCAILERWESDGRQPGSPALETDHGRPGTLRSAGRDDASRFRHLFRE